MSFRFTTVEIKLALANILYREKLQNCPKVQNGDFDLDGLCADLQKKAKCSGHGAVVDEKDFKVVMTKYLGKDKDDVACAQSLAMESRS